MVTDPAQRQPMRKLALAWLLNNPVVSGSPIVGATKPHHLAYAVAALDAEFSPKKTVYGEEPLQRIAKARGVSMAQIALAWVLRSSARWAGNTLDATVPPDQRSANGAWSGSR